MAFSLYSGFGFARGNFAPEGGGGAPIRIEAEDLTGAGIAGANNFLIKRLASASGRETLALASKKTGIGSADLDQLATVGTFYQVRIVYIDETDGNSAASIAVDGTVVGAWRLDGSAGVPLFPGQPVGTGNQAGNYRSITFDTAFLVDADTVLTLTATRNAGEVVRIDYIELIPIPEPNVAPTAIAPDTATVAENTAGAAIATLAVTDPNALDTHSFVVSDSRFEVVGGVLRLKVGQALDAEAAGAVTVAVTATDAGGLSVTENVVITVGNVNEAPTQVALSAQTLAENMPGGVVGTLTAVDPDAADTITFSVDDGRFEVAGTTLKLRDGVVLDFEAGAAVTVVVTATDAGGLGTTQSFTLAVTNANEAPTAIALGGAAVTENAAGATIGALTVTDPDAGDTHSYAVDDARFEVVGGALRLKDGVALDFEAAASVTVGVTATDAGGASVSRQFVIAVGGVNEAPTELTLAGQPVRAGTAGATVGALTITDPDAGDTHGYAVSDARFEVSGGVLRLQAGVALTVADNGTVVTVTGTDAGGLTVARDFAVAVTEENRAPSFASGPTAVTVAENTRAVATYVGTDPDGAEPPLVYTIAGGADAARFTIGANGALAFAAAPDFEGRGDANGDNVYLVTVAVSDGVLSATRDVAVTVGNVVERFTPVRLEAEDFAGVGATNNFVLETLGTASEAELVRLNVGRTGNATQSLSGFVPGFYTARVVYLDETDGQTSATLSINGGAIGTWTFDGVTGAQVFPGERTGTTTQLGNFRSVEFTTVFEVTAGSVLRLGAVQNGAESARIDYVELRPVEGPNGIPTGITLSGGTVAENAAGAAVGTLVVADPDAGSAHRFAVADGRFEVVGTTLRLKAGISLDREAGATIGVAVTATDRGGLSVTEVVTVTVGNVNEAPTAITLASPYVTDELAGASVGALVVADPDLGATHSFTVSDARFEVVDGVLKLKAGEALDFPATQAVTLTVTATDQGGLAVAQQFTIGVNAPPTGITVDGPFTVNENVAGASFGDVTINDGNSGDIHVYTLSDSRFEVAGGVLKLKDGVSLDHETGATVSLDVTATDPGGLSVTGSYVIAVGDLNETATQITLTGSTITENARRVTVGVLSANDPDAGDTLTFSTEDNRFEIDGNVLKLVSNFFDFEAGSVFNLQVEVTDSSGAVFTQRVPITILDVNEAPVVGVGPATVTIREGFTAVATYQGVDVDAGASLSYFLAAGGDAALFSVDAATGALSFLAPRDFEAPVDANADNIYQVTVGVSDGTFTATKAVAVTVADVQEAGTPTLFTRKIDFTPADAPIATGYLADIGQAYNAADGYGWVTEASVADGTANGTVPDAINVYGNDEIGAVFDRENEDYDQRLTSYAHFEFPRAPDSSAGAWAWEHALTDGTYQVTVAIGDTGGQNDSFNVLNIEGQNVLPGFQPVGGFKSILITTVATVTDGRLTLDSIGGDNTEIQYVEIEQLADQTPGDGRPVEADYGFFLETLALIGGQDSVPLDQARGISVNAGFSTGIGGLNDGEFIRLESINTQTVRLIETLTGNVVTGFVNTDAVGGTISFRPSAPLKGETGYTLILDGVETTTGEDLIAETHSFLTGVSENAGDGEVAFAREEMSVSADIPYSSLTVSPDGTKLYATTLAGTIVRWDIDAGTGVLLNEQVFTTPALEFRALIGIVFDPNDPDVFWVSNNDPLGSTDAVDFTGKITRFTLQDGPDFQAVAEDYVVGLPRSVRDHLSNSLAFHTDPDTGEQRLYLVQGSNSAMGAPDNVWGNRPERLLSAAVLEIDTSRDISVSGPIDVQTQDPNVALPPGAGAQVGYYNPFAADAPVTLFATGLRNAYDLVFHSNGYLYVPANGSAAGGNTPDDPNTAVNEALTGVDTQNDFLFKVEDGFYYGHPNPVRGEYILNGGNPTAGEDPSEITGGGGYPGYPVGVTPPANYGGIAYDFSRNRSPNGAIEYLASTGAWGDALKNALLVVEYSAGKDIVVLRFDPVTGEVLRDANGDPIADTLTDARGNTLLFDNPLDIVANANGFIYVAQLNQLDGGQITLLRPIERDPTPPQDRILEAESAILAGARVGSLPYGASNNAYVDFTNNVGAGESITWRFDVEEAGIYLIKFRYALSNAPKDADGRPLTLNVNGDNETTFTFLPSGANFRSWGFESYEVALNVGVNTVKLTSISASGANIDYLAISPEPLTALNTRPTIEGTQADVSFVEGEAFSFAVRDVVVDDVDPGDFADYVARLKGGGELPSWLDFEGPTQTFSTNNSAPIVPGVYEIELVADDGQDESAARVVFAIEIVRQFDSADVDGDGVLNAGDTDDDDDGVPDGRDPFQSDPSNGLTTPLYEGRSIVYHFEGRPFGADAGYGGFGLTGFRVSGNRSPEALGLGSANISVVDGKLHIEDAGRGDLATGDSTLGVQFGIDPVARFYSVSATFDHPYDTRAPARGQNFGLVIGTGDHSSFVKLVLEGRDANGAFLQLETREDGVRDDANSPAFGRTNALAYRQADANDTVTFTFTVDALLGQITASWSLRNGAQLITGTGPTVTVTGDLLDAIRGEYTVVGAGGADVASGLAVGIVTSSRAANPLLDVDVLDITVTGIESDPDIVLVNPEAPVLGARAVFNWIDDPTANNGVGNPPREFKDSAIIRVRNDGNDVLSVTGLDLDGPFQFLDASDTLAFSLDAGGFRDIEIGFDNSSLAYDPEVSRLFEGELKVFSDDPDAPVARADLAGYWNSVPEGGEEASFNALMEVFGYGTRADQNVFDDFDIYEPAGPDEILSPYWRIADGYTSVTVTQLAALHDISNAAIFIYEPGNNVQEESKAVLTHDSLYNQSLLPLRTNGTDPVVAFDAAFIPDEWAESDVFGFRVAGQFSDPRLNRDGPGDGPPGAQRGHFIRFFVAKDEAGNVIEDTFIVAQDYQGINYDYQDNLYVVQGIEAVEHLMFL